jgi:hypothetical protein
MSQTRRLAAILAADVVGYSRLMEADEEDALERLKGIAPPVVYRANVTEISLRGSRPGAIESLAVAPLKRGEGGMGAWRKTVPRLHRKGSNAERDTLPRRNPPDFDEGLD